MQRLSACYTGPDGHRGLEWNKRYMLDITNHTTHVVGTNTVITYNSIESFFKDWIVTGFIGVNVGVESVRNRPR